MTDSLIPLSKDDLHREALRWAGEVRSLDIHSGEGAKQASYLLRSIKSVRNDIQKWFSPHIEAAMETKRRADAARKALVDEMAKMEAPLVNAEGVVKQALLAWEGEQERLRREEEQRLQAEAQKEAEAQTVAAAAELERLGNQMGATDMLEEAAALLAQPVEAPAVVVKSFVPKVQGISYRDTYKAHPDVDVQALAGAVASGTAPVSFIEPNMTAINAYARATKSASSVPGIRFIVDRQIAARG